MKRNSQSLRPCTYRRSYANTSKHIRIYLNAAIASSTRIMALHERLHKSIYMTASTDATRKRRSLQNICERLNTIYITLNKTKPTVLFEHVDSIIECLSC